MHGNGNSWLLHTQKSLDAVRTKDMTSLSKQQHQDLGWVVQEQLHEVSALLTDIGTRLEVLSQVLWAKDSQELS